MYRGRVDGGSIVRTDSSLLSPISTAYKLHTQQLSVSLTVLWSIPLFAITFNYTVVSDLLKSMKIVVHAIESISSRAGR